MAHFRLYYWIIVSEYVFMFKVVARSNGGAHFNQAVRKFSLSVAISV